MRAMRHSMWWARIARVERRLMDLVAITGGCAEWRAPRPASRAVGAGPLRRAVERGMDDQGMIWKMVPQLVAVLYRRHWPLPLPPPAPVVP